MNIHFASVHEKKKAFKCKICDIGFTQKADNEDSRSVHEGEKRYHCGICDCLFKSKAIMNKHVKSIHEKKKSLKSTDMT